MPAGMHAPARPRNPGISAKLGFARNPHDLERIPGGSRCGALPAGKQPHSSTSNGVPPAAL